MNTPSSKDKRAGNWNTRIRGQKFEQLAAHFYEQNGFEILQSNYRSGHKELDLIVRKTNLVVFVEVKSSGTRTYGHPVEKVDARKIKNLSEAAQQFLIENKVEGCDLRFDVVTFIDGRLEHYPNAFSVD